MTSRCAGVKTANVAPEFDPSRGCALVPEFEAVLWRDETAA